MQCTYGCSRQFANLAAMNDHRMASHNTSSTKKKRPVTACNCCGKTFSSNDALHQHQLNLPNHIRVARGINSSQCAECNRTLRDQDSLEQHFVADHAIIKLAEGDRKRVELEREFFANWRKPSRPGSVLNVFKVYNPGWRTLEFQVYKQKLPHAANEVQRYHGTSFLCELGSGARTTKLCQRSHEGCNLCSILLTGFKTAKVKDTWQRFGKGIYSTTTSGKANDYIRSSSNMRAVLICRVLTGNAYRTQQNMPTLEAPPEGYDSVFGEVGRDLNYDETVVYSSNAILPEYLLVYKRDM